MIRPFRFGVNNTGEDSLKAWQEYARKAEDLGYGSLIMQDHFAPQLAPFPALAAAAAVTSRIRLTTLVLDNDFRHPALVAKEAATVDVLSDGRLDLGLGAGWLQADYDKLGWTFDAPGVRMSRFAEAVKIVKAYLSEDKPFSFHGAHYQVTDMDTSPRPVQRPHPPLLIGGRQKRMLSFAAREADIVSISMLDPRGPDRPPPPSFRDKVGWVREAAGDRFESIQVHVNAGGARVTDDQRSAIEEVAQRSGMAPEQVLESPANLIGSVDAIAEQLERWREETAVSFFVVPVGRMLEFAPVVARMAGA